MPLRTRGVKRGAACWPKWWQWETVRNPPGAWPKRLPISLALPKLQGIADQVAGAAQGVKMDFWTTAKFVLLLLAGSAALRNIWRLPLPMGAKVASTMGLAVSLLWFVRYLMGYVQNT